MNNETYAVISLDFNISGCLCSTLFVHGEILHISGRAPVTTYNQFTLRHKLCRENNLYIF